MDNTNWWFIGFNRNDENDTDSSMPETKEAPKAKARRLVALRGSYTAEISGPPTMEIR